MAFRQPMVEMLRLLRREFSLMSRPEALHYGEAALKYTVKKADKYLLLDVLREEVGAEIESFHAMLEASLIYSQISDLRLNEGDQFMLYSKLSRQRSGPVALWCNFSATTFGKQIFLTHVLRRQAVELSPKPIQDGRDEMEVDAGEGGGADGPEPMTIDTVEEGKEGVEVEEGDSWLNNLLNQTQNDLWNKFCLRNKNDLVAMDQENGSSFVEDFGGEKVTVKVPEHSVDELTGAAQP
eukprot:s649_g25.t1